jgi:hypothetical protein
VEKAAWELVFEAGRMLDAEIDSLSLDDEVTVGTSSTSVLSTTGQAHCISRHVELLEILTCVAQFIITAILVRRHVSMTLKCPRLACCSRFRGKARRALAGLLRLSSMWLSSPSSLCA